MREYFGQDFGKGTPENKAANVQEVTEIKIVAKEKWDLAGI